MPGFMRAFRSKERDEDQAEHVESGQGRHRYTENEQGRAVVLRRGKDGIL